MKNMVREYYSENYKKYGVSPKSLGWLRGKQDIRFYELTKRFELNKNFSILDIGCGFGDINRFLASNNIEDYSYLGIDIMQEFIDVATDSFKEDSNKVFLCEDFRNVSINESFDYIIGSGIFNVNLQNEDNYDMVSEIMSKAIRLCNQNGAVSFDFQSDKVDYKAESEYAFYYSPEKVLKIAYDLTRRVILDNTFFPFEFSITLFCNDSFSDDLIYSEYK